MTAPVIGPTPGAEVMIPCGSRSWTSVVIRSSTSLISSGSASANRASTAMSSARSGKASSSVHSLRVASAAARIALASVSPKAP
jgi:hypothetical protein